MYKYALPLLLETCYTNIKFVWTTVINMLNMQKPKGMSYLVNQYFPAFLYCLLNLVVLVFQGGHPVHLVHLSRGVLVILKDHPVQ